MPQSSSITASLRITASRVADFVSALHGPIDLGGTVLIENGTGAGLADLAYVDQITLAASATQTLDLSGALTDALGAALVFARVRALYLEADAGNVNNVVLGNLTNSWLGPFGAATHSLAVRPGGRLLLLAPLGTSYPVTPGTGDLLQFANGGGATPVTFNLAILGASA